MSTPAQVPQNPQEREVTAGTPSPMERYPEEKNVAMDSPQATRSSNEDWNEQRPDDGVKKPWWNSIFVMGSTTQIIIAALLGIVIGVSVSTNVEKVPKQAITILLIPGDLWLRGLKAAVLPLIVTAMIIAVQRLKEETSSKGKKLAWVTVGYYVVTTVIAIGHSTIMVALVWAPMMPIASSDVLQLTEKQKADFKARNERTVDESVQDVFRSFVPDNIVSAMANTELLSVLMTAVVFGALLKPNSAIMKAVVEIERIVMIILTFLIKLAPIGVFFLVMPNLLKLDIAVIGQSLGVLIAGALANMAIHLFFVTSIIYFAVVRKNPYTYFIKCAPAWITGWGTASSAATMPVTMRVAKERGCPETVRRFAIPLGTLINMDGTSIYFPVVVTFLARTQGITLDATQYVLVVLLSTLSAIATTPIPSASLVLTVMICNAVGVPMTGMYGVVVAVDWFLDRFRTALNVLGDLYGVGVITKITKITDDDVPPETVGETVHHTGPNAV